MECIDNMRYVDYDMMDFFSRWNKKLLITLKNGDKIQSSVGSFYNDLIFFGKFPESVKFTHYSLQIKHFDKIEIL